MAGIGFELKRVISQGNLSSTVGATLAGVFVVAGPWLLTIATLFVLGQVFQTLQMDHVGLFQVAAIYSYAVSLGFFSVIHFGFIRIVADLIWLKRQNEAAGWLVRFVVAVALLAAAVGSVALAWMPLGLEDAGLFRVAAVVLFVAVNLLWLAMFFISLLKHYGRILAVYLGGMAASVGLVAWWGGLWGVGGAVLGFAVGHWLIVAGLLALCFHEFWPAPVAHAWATVGKTVGSFGKLLAAGGLFYLGQWLDKLVFWATRGQPVDGSWFQLYPVYDFPVYVAGLTVIPGLVYFVITLETSFASSLQKFANNLGSGTYAAIVKSRFVLVRTTHEELRAIALFQGAFTALALAVVALVAPEQGLVYGLALVGALGQLLLMVVLNLLFYAEFHAQALASASAFFLVQALGALVGAAVPLAPGIGFLAAVAAGCLVGWWLLLRSLRSVDRRIYVRAAVPTLK